VEVRKHDVARLRDAAEEGDGCTWQLALVHGYAENSCLFQKEDGNFLFWLVSMSIIIRELVSTVLVFGSCAGGYLVRIVGAIPPIPLVLYPFI
jgi:hypothetical protein